MIRPFIWFFLFTVAIYFLTEVIANKFLFMKIKRSRILAFALICATLSASIIGTIVYLF